tara:strand:+ start:27 stop:467 length:441 start_codon:yes stop_codon:yes gene_type:complete
MSYTFEYTTNSGETQTITILTRKEIALLDDYDKIQYQAGPMVDSEHGDLNTLAVQAFIYDFINEVYLYFIPRALDEFIKLNYKNKHEESWNLEIEPSEREELFWNFIDEVGDEALDGIDLHILNSIYKDDDLYSMLIEECEKRTKD